MQFKIKNQATKIKNQATHLPTMNYPRPCAPTRPLPPTHTHAGVRLVMLAGVRLRRRGARRSR